MSISLILRTNLAASVEPEVAEVFPAASLILLLLLPPSDATETHPEVPGLPVQQSPVWKCSSQSVPVRAGLTVGWEGGDLTLPSSRRVRGESNRSEGPLGDRRPPPPLLSVLRLCSNSFDSKSGPLGLIFSTCQTDSPLLLAEDISGLTAVAGQVRPPHSNYLQLHLCQPVSHPDLHFDPTSWQQYNSFRRWMIS